VKKKPFSQRNLLYRRKSPFRSWISGEKHFQKFQKKKKKRKRKKPKKTLKSMSISPPLSSFLKKADYLKI